MANDHNSITIVGRLGSDPEVRQTQAGSVTSMRVAVGWKGKNGDGTDWFSVTAFNRLGEIAAQYCKRGGQVLLSGRMRSREYTNKDGYKVTAWELIASDLQLLGSKGDGQQSRPQPTPASSPVDDFNPDTDIPF